MATIKQIAIRTGLSPQTVSHVLGGHSNRHRPETRERVLTAAREMGYRANSSARAMRSGRSGCIGLLQSSGLHHGPLTAGLLDGIQDALSEKDLHLTLARLSDEKLTSDEFVPKMLRQYMVDGLLSNYQNEIPFRLQELISQHQMPVVWINSQQETDCVYPDDADAGRRATEHLLALGHRRIAFADYPASTHYSNADRYRGYAQAMRAAGATPRLIQAQAENVTTSDWERHAVGWLSEPERPTGVVAYHPAGAQPLRYAAQSLGLSIPRDLSVITFQNHVPANTGLSFTTWLIPEYSVGRLAVEMLLSKIQEPARGFPPQAVPYTKTGGETCAPVPPQNHSHTERT